MCNADPTNGTTDVPDVAAFLKTAVSAARAGGEVLMRFYGGDFEIRKKGVIDLVTEADTQSEAEVMRVIREAHPGHGILAEESGDHPEDGRFTWIVDPLDGTTNFAHGYPFFCVSVGLRHGGAQIAGAVYAPYFRELFWASRGGGAWLNGERIRVSTVSCLGDALLVTGFPYDIRKRDDDTVALFVRFLQRAQAVRRDGSAALNMCYVAAGRFDGFWERDLRPWDTAAALVLIEEAGGVVTRYDGSPFDVFVPEILAGTPRVHAAMIPVIAERPPVP